MKIDRPLSIAVISAVDTALLVGLNKVPLTQKNILAINPTPQTNLNTNAHEALLRSFLVLYTTQEQILLQA